MMNQPFVGSSAILTMFAISACAHSSQQNQSTVSSALASTQQAVRAIALCTTTEAELRRDFGTPTRDGILRNDRIVSWIVGESDPVKYLAVLLDSRGVVVDLYWDIPTEVPWVPANQCP